MKNEKKPQNVRFKVTINCEDCGAERLITKACLNLVKRCKSCQKIFNRNRARNRYRELKGIPIDKPIVGRKKEKESKKEPKKEPPKNTRLIKDLKPKPEPKDIKPELSEAELQRQQAVMNKLFETIKDKSTIDDW